ncbi:Hsp20/alpha crystallin family protein [Fulvivirgaceae bacterium BMA12]|uniref:Hsp20/alpha crystallin family protein n=1 Tax=Agaribacillus aureus TaxID=3051825 RepID=A0ABT8LDN6_9BACT|nr:Hsp20/alpha crystallin family protein [Fulvivirgaceae bacterium BMA12]
MTLVKYKNDFNDYVPTNFSSLLDNFFNDRFHFTGTNRTFLPKVDIAESEEGFEVSLAAPGMKKEDFKIEVNENYLTIAGERKFTNEDKGKNYHTVETQYGTFSKSFKLPKNVNGEKINAKYEAGILNLFVPKDEKKKLKNTITVK